MQSYRIGRLRALLLASLGFNIATAALSQAAAPGASVQGDIVVTAERRETNLLRTPGSITPIPPQDLQDRHIENLNDLAVSVPGVSQTGGSPQTSLFIRGIGTTDPGAPQSVGFYVDDVYNPRTFGNNVFDLLDVQSVEVLRGPQGTLYGQNASGGAIKVVSKKPSDTAQATVLAELGNYNAVRVAGYLTGPIIPGLLDASAAVTKRTREGFVYNQTLNYNVDNVDSSQARIKLRLTPAPNLEAVAAYTLLRDDSDTQSIIPLNYGDGDKRVTYTSHRVTPKRNVDTYSLHLSDTLNDHLSLKSITAYRKLNNLNPVEMSGKPGDLDGFVQLLINKQWSQELQLAGNYGRLNFLAGAIYRNETFTLDRDSYLNNAYSEILSAQTVTDKAIYGQATYEVFDRLRLTLGGRYGSVKNSFSNSYYITNSAYVRTRTVYNVAGLHDSENDFSPKVQVDWQALNNLLLYASWTKGSKDGGFNRAAASAQVAGVAVRPESVKTTEVGLKGKTADGLFRGSLAFFYNDFRDYQSSITNPVIDGQLVVGSVLANAASATTYGGEAETTLQPSRRSRLRASVSYLHSKFDSFANPTGAAASNYSGNRLPYASKWIVNADVKYTLPLDVPGKLSLNASTDYHSRAFSDVGNTPQLEVPQQWNIDTGATYETANGLWTFQALVRNVTDRLAIIGFRYYVPALNVNAAKYTTPRLFTFSVKRTF